MKILVSNDDGVYSPGLQRLAEALAKLGEVYVVAPDRERNAASHSLTLHKPLRAEQVAERVFAINGTPTDCINLGVNFFMPERPSLIVSGINKGENLGDDISYSGTVSAAIEGTILGIPSFAISQARLPAFSQQSTVNSPQTIDDGQWSMDYFETAAEFALILARMILKRGLPRDTFLNVNVPNLPIEKIKGVRITCQGKRLYDATNIIEKVDPRGKKYYWIGGNRLSWEKKENTDFEAVSEGMISVTPLHLDLTNYSAIEELLSWEIPLRER